MDDGQRDTQAVPASNGSSNNSIAPPASVAASIAAAASVPAAAAVSASSASPIAAAPASSDVVDPPLPVGPEQAAHLYAALQPLLANSLVELLEGLETLIVYTRNLILFPDEKKYAHGQQQQAEGRRSGDDWLTRVSRRLVARLVSVFSLVRRYRKIKMSNIHYVERLGHLPGAEAAMTAIGYVAQGEYLRLDETRLHTADNEALLKAVDQIAMKKLNDLKKQWAVLPARTHATHAYRCVQAVGSHSAIGKRHNMEDDEIMVDSFCGTETQGYFGLYDGHGGRATVDFVVKALHIVRTSSRRQQQRAHALGSESTPHYILSVSPVCRVCVCRIWSSIC